MNLTMKVIIDGKEQDREVSYIAYADAESKIAYSVPILEPGEFITRNIDGRINIYKKGLELWL